MAENTNRPKENEIVKGKIANALTSAAKNHIVATTDDLYDTYFEEYQDEINKRVVEVIPDEASSENQLADKTYVLDLIHKTSSAFRGNWTTWEDVPTDTELYPADGEGNKIPRQGDYIIIEDSSDYGEEYSGTWKFAYIGEWEAEGKDGWNPEYKIGGNVDYLNVVFYKKKEGSETREYITTKLVAETDTLVSYPELTEEEYEDGGYWDTVITDLREMTGDTEVYYITPFLTFKDNKRLLEICFENGWSNSPAYLTINEAQSITNEMVAEASKKLAFIEDSNGNIIPVFDCIVYEEDGEDPIVMKNYNLFSGLCWDKYENEYDIIDCVCYSKDGVRYSLDEVHYGNCFYNLGTWNELPYFTQITSLGDGETYRVFLDYSKIREIDLSNISALPEYTLFRCNSLEELYIPSGLTDIETYAIASCDGLRSLIVDENNPKYTSRDSNGNECNCIVEKPATRGIRSAINNELTLIQGCNVTTLPDNIKHIASGAFDECTRLTGITLPDGLLTIDDNVFRGCTALEGNVIVPNTVESIGDYSFKGCSSLQGVNINVPVVSQQLFKDCSGLSSVTLGSGVTEIGNQAFMNDSSLTAITIPDSVVSAGTSAFMNCDLRSVNANNIETISDNIFAYNSNLSNITMTDSTVNIGHAAFMGCVSLTSVTIPQNVRSLLAGAFMYCNNLQRVVWDVNDTVISHFAGAFVLNKETITSFEFGEHCTVIPNGLCSGTGNMTGITIPNNITKIGQNVFFASGLINISIPNSVTIVGPQTFRNCNNLETVTIGSGIATIPIICFMGCSSLKTVDLSNNPNKINLQNINAFSNCDNLSLIIVPDDLIAEYRESQDWYEYREIIFGKSVYTITFDSISGETTPETQNVRCGGYIENPGTIHKDLYEFEYWEDENGYVWDFDEDYVVGDMTLYAHYREVKAIMIKSISTGVTDVSMSYNGSYPANVEYSYDGINWYDIWYNNYLNISLSDGYNHYVYFRGYNPNGFSRDWGNYAKFGVGGGQCNLLGNIMYLKNYNEELDYVNSFEFYNLFLNCNAVVNSNNLELPATTLATYCYGHMFSNCTSLTAAPELPSITLADYCYAGMFEGCTSLTEATELPATTLAGGCYQNMFNSCTSLTEAPELPVTTLANTCYSGMFSDCSSLTTAPALPATTLASYCYSNMFGYCTSLTTTPELPATTLADSCYSNMFQNCSSLTAAHELPATTLASYCYYAMFQSCSSLTTAPELPATALTQYCYSYMFNGCSSLNYIKCLAVNGINENDSTYIWVKSVQTNSGTFIKHPDATDWPSGNNGIPTNWTVEDAVI